MDSRHDDARHRNQVAGGRPGGQQGPDPLGPVDEGGQGHLAAVAPGHEDESTRTMSAAEVVAAGAGVSQARVARQARRA